MAPLESFSDGASRLATAARPTVENILVHQRIDSTHACALRLIEQAEAEEIVLPTTLIIAGRQDHGLGRSGRSWVSPTGGLYMSWLSANLDPKIVAQLPMIAAAAAHAALSRLGIHDLVIKWPNDLLVGGRKLAGILVHARHASTTWATIGVGINLDHAPAIHDDGAIPATAVTDLVTGGDYWTWAETIVEAFAAELSSGVVHPAAHIATWRTCLHHQSGDLLTVRCGDGSVIRGAFSGLTEDGHLRIDIDGTEQVISTGDVVE